MAYRAWAPGEGGEVALWIDARRVDDDPIRMAAAETVPPGTLPAGGNTCPPPLLLFSSSSEASCYSAAPLM